MVCYFGSRLIHWSRIIKYEMNLKAFAILLAFICSGFGLVVHGADQKLIDLLIKKGLVTQAEADTVTQQAPGVDKTLVDLLVGKGHLTQAEADSLGASKVKQAEVP